MYEDANFADCRHENSDCVYLLILWYCKNQCKLSVIHWMRDTSLASLADEEKMEVEYM